MLPCPQSVYGFAAAYELWWMPVASQSWPAITLLVLASASHLSWIPITLTSSLGSVTAAMTSVWLPYVVLATLLMRLVPPNLC